MTELSTDSFKTLLDTAFRAYAEASSQCSVSVSRIVAGESGSRPIWLSLNQGEMVEPVDVWHPLSVVMRKWWMDYHWPRVVKSLKQFGTAYVWVTHSEIGLPDAVFFLENRSVMRLDDGSYRIDRDERPPVFLPEKDVICIAIPSPLSKGDGWLSFAPPMDGCTNSLTLDEQKDLACNLAGVPCSLFDEQSYDKHKQAFDVFIQLSVKPLLTLLGDALTAKLAKRFGDDLCIHWSGPTQ